MNTVSLPVVRKVLEKCISSSPHQSTNMQDFTAKNFLSVLPVAVTVTAALALYATGSFQNALGSVSGISHVSPHG